ncbi:toprim domain-containing protein [Ferrovibrio terrae]|uniref:DUF7146 domain-containing protein n=1 Tax=Ferrovibrio terrae TaxID=2594003 RepID=UPI0031380C64
MSPVAPRRYEIAELIGMLKLRTLDLCMELLPGGVKRGQEWKCGSLAGEAGNSMAVHLSGPRAGLWMDGATGETGDVYDLIAQVLFNGDKKKTYQWVLQHLGLENPGRGAPQIQRRVKSQAEIDAEKRDAIEESEATRKRAHAIWLSGQPIEGTPAAAYLAGRGIDIARLGRWPRSLRYHAKVYHGLVQQHFPAMVAVMVDATGTVRAIHRTFLQIHDDGRVTKAAVLGKEAKLCLGAYGGSSIHLWRGKSGKRFTDAPLDDVLAIAEGIEEAMTIAMAHPDWRIISGVSVGAMSSLQLPQRFQHVVLCAQNDPELHPDPARAARGERHPARIGLDKAAQELKRDHMLVEVVRPDPRFKDWNDWLCNKPMVGE